LVRGPGAFLKGIKIIPLEELCPQRPKSELV
jgi:hypothetical protein